MLATRDIRSMTLRESPYRPLRISPGGKQEGQRDGHKVKVPGRTIT